MSNVECILVAGIQGSAKTSYVEPYTRKGYVRLNRDTIGGRTAGLRPLMVKALREDYQNVIMDNTFLTAKARAPFVQDCKECGVPIHAVWMNTRPEDSQYNICQRMVRRYKHILSPSEISESKDPNIFPPFVLFSAIKQAEKPAMTEGFASVKFIDFVRAPQELEYANKALILDYDGTLRETKSGNKFPVVPSDVKIMAGRVAVLKKYAASGYRLLGVSNQSGISKGDFSEEDARACFDRTNELLGVDIEYAFCPHVAGPLQCWCRKPMMGMVVNFIEKYKLKKSGCIFVGDQTTDRTCATRCDMPFLWANDFFGTN